MVLKKSLSRAGASSGAEVALLRVSSHRKTEKSMKIIDFPIVSYIGISYGISYVAGPGESGWVLDAGGRPRGPRWVPGGQPGHAGGSEGC